MVLKKYGFGKNTRDQYYEYKRNIKLIGSA